MDAFNVQIAGLAAQAVAASKQHDMTLDYSATSLESVEQLLEKVSRDVDKFDEQKVTDLVAVFGCYILEVAHKQLGGRYCWYDPRNQPVLVIGEPRFRVAMIAFDHVWNRLHGNTEQSIPKFFEGFADRVEHAQPDTDVLYA